MKKKMGISQDHYSYKNRIIEYPQLKGTHKDH